jgi:D-3-phosphoglycerate dehydrogenase / 2-oxoglutarate reductase
MKPFRVLLYENMHQAGIDLLAEKAELIIANNLEENSLIEQARDVDAIVIRANGAVTARIMDSAPKLKVVGRHGVGVDAIDLNAAKQRGIVVCNTPDANLESVAEQAVGFMITLSKQILRADQALRQGRWNVRYEYIGQEMDRRTLGLVGMGRIGARVAEICHFGFRMPIIYHDVIAYPDLEERLSAKKLPLDEVLKKADYISLHVPLLPATKGLIGAEQLAMMKKGAFLINTSRGAIVDEADLIKALRSGHLGGAGLDVFDTEPTPADNPLLQFDNVVLTPHMAAHTDDALKAMSMVAEDIIRVLEGKEPLYRVV